MPSTAGKVTVAPQALIKAAGSAKVAALQDINKREALVLTSLAAAVLILGIWPAPLIEVMDVSIENLVRHIAVTKL